MTLYKRSYQIDYFYGWRYLFSEKFRNQAKQKWGSNLILRSLLLIAGFFGILLTSALVVLLLMAIWQLNS